MKKVLCVSALLLLLSASAFGASRQELKRMSTFLSNFTELGMYNINVDTIPEKDLVHFGIWHNYINNYKSRIKPCPRGSRCSYGDVVISSSYVEESVEKFFDLELEHQSTDNEHYDGKYYHFYAADGEIPYYADVQEVSRKGSVITLRGELYNAEDEDERPARFTARVKPYRWKGEDRWALLTLTTRWEE